MVMIIKARISRSEIGLSVSSIESVERLELIKIGGIEVSTMCWSGAVLFIYLTKTLVLITCKSNTFSFTKNSAK